MSTRVKQFVLAEPRKRTVQGPPFCYQQGDNDCGYFCLRIAAEITIGRKFDAAERRVFSEQFLSLCLMSGERLEKSTEEFNQTFSSDTFPELGTVYFATKEATVFSPQDVIEKLDEGQQVVVLNIQNMDFRSKTFVSGRYGHNVCCIGHDNGKLIFADSNRVSGSCRKTMAIEILQEGYDRILNATKNADDLLDAQKKVMRTHPTHISEMYWVTREQQIKSRRLRRSKRRRQ
jgi:hypothetical protein